MKELSIEKFIDTYSKYKDYIQDMYMFECLTTSGFTEYQAYTLKSTLKDLWLKDLWLKDLWLKDENRRCISGLSDMLYEYSQAHDMTQELTEIPTRKLLVELYKECE